MASKNTSPVPPSVPKNDAQLAATSVDVSHLAKALDALRDQIIADPDARTLVAKIQAHANLSFAETAPALAYVDTLLISNEDNGEYATWDNGEVLDSFRRIRALLTEPAPTVEDL